MKTTYPSAPAISIESLEPQLSASHPILRDLSHCSFLPSSKSSQHARWIQLYHRQPQASFRDLEKHAHLRFIKESVLDRSFQGSLKPQANPSASFGKGICGQREGVGGSDLESNRQLLISFWGKRLWTALTLMEKGVSSRFKYWPGERTRYKKEATEEESLSYLQISWNSYPDTT